MTDRSASGRPPARQEPDDSHRTVASLLEERSKYQAWMDALDARRDSSPEHVFRRVRRDYEERLAQVAKQLARQLPALRTATRELAEKITELRVEESALQDQRAEAELRAHVGELAGEKWDKVARKHDDGIRAVTERRESLEKELEAVEKLVASARDSIEMAAIPEESAEDEEAGEDGAEVAPEQPATEEDPEKLRDEMAFLRSVTGASQRVPNGQPRRPKGPVPAASAPAPGAPKASPSPAPRVSEAPKAAPKPESKPEPKPVAAAAAAKPPEGIAADPSPDKEGPGDEAPEKFFDPSDDSNPLRDLRTAERPIVTNASDSLVLRADASQPKTLKCAGCGTMNFPTEWYCERCGAELAEL